MPPRINTQKIYLIINCWSLYVISLVQVLYLKRRILSWGNFILTFKKSFFLLHYYTMILPRIRIIVLDAGFEPRNSVPEVWCAPMSHHISDRWATTSPKSYSLLLLHSRQAYRNFYFMKTPCNNNIFRFNFPKSNTHYTEICFRKWD